MTQPTAFSQLQAFLKEMFQFDEHDLDIGIYKIIRLKKNFIQNFIEGEGANSLKGAVKDALAKVQDSSRQTASNWLSSFAVQFGDRGKALWQAVADNPEDPAAVKNFEKLLELASEQDREQAEKYLQTLAETEELSLSDLEARVYNHLLNFFELYYQNGDFGYNTRAAKAFKVPYEADYDGSDTMFHWKHKDSYYIKTGNGFNRVRFQVNGAWIEFRLQGRSSDQSTARNNVKESEVKHYRLQEIRKIEEPESDNRDGADRASSIWQVLFSLDEKSTSKTEIYQQIWDTLFADDRDLSAYLHKKPEKGEKIGKPIFKDLPDSYDQVQGGQLKGISQLRLKEDTYFSELAKREEFKELGKNASVREQALREDIVASALIQIDRRLNTFYVGNDADFFIHKDLQGFLSKEKERYIKNVIFSDLNGLLQASRDSTTLQVARAFNQVADRIISFLDTIETFQKNLFELKKKVVDTHYLISVGKVPVEFYERILAGKEQLLEWQEIFQVKVQSVKDLQENPGLVLDTSLYFQSDPNLQDDILSSPEFDNLDEQIEGVLINSENWQALNLLQEKYRNKVQCIHIDPPYNTASSGFLYKNEFKHSSWLTMMYNRISMSIDLLNDTGSFICHIDENEYENLFTLFNSYDLPNANTVQYGIKGILCLVEWE